jgi:hypothetical protein
MNFALEVLWPAYALASENQEATLRNITSK